ncbi:hypothetical protein F25303_12391 [Fusarium sp. NRRL 25303]|nr:hypothetical protein F25303_12391 [Fusarium sp. NRRL 25303]
MVSEGPPRQAIVLGSTTLTPDTAHALGPSPGASSSIASTDAVTPGRRATRSDWQVGNALFGLQMKPFHAPDHGTTVSSSPGPPREDQVLAASLNPYRDGRIRTAVPSKLKGRTNMKQGNFSVMHMHIQKPQITERDLAAKLTSERTAAAAKLASAQGYRYPRRPRPPHTAAARNPPQSLSNHSSVTADIHGPVAQSPPLGTVMSYEERRADRGLAQASTRLVENPLTEAGSMENLETEILAESTKGDVAPANHEQENAPFIDANSARDVSMNPSNEIATPVDPTQEANREQPTITKLLTTTLPPEEVRAEQYRLLELLRKLHPGTVVETLCSALTRLGGVTRRLPSPDGESSESGSKKSSGDLLIAWISEIFPPNFAENSATKRPSKPLTGRPRGRPKGSTKRIVDADLHLKRTAFVPLAMRPNETDGTQRSTLVECSNAPPESVANNPRLDMPLPYASKNQSSTSALRNTFALPELPDPAEETASPMQGGATDSPGCTEVSRTRTAAGSSVIIQGPQGPPRHRQDADLVSSKKRKNSQQGPCTNTQVIDIPQISPGTAKLVTNPPHEKQVKRLRVSHSLSHLSQQDQGLKQFDEFYQTQADQGVHVQRKHHSPQDLISEQSIRPMSLSSPTHTQSRSCDLVAPEDVLPKVTVVDLYQRQQRQLSDQLGHSAAGFPQTASSSSHQQGQRLGSRPLVSQHRQQGLRRSTGTTPLASMDHFESHHRLEKPAQIASMDETPSKPPKTASAPVADMS